MFQTKAKVIKNIEVAKKYYKIVLSCAPIARSAQPGQFAQIKVSDSYEPLLRRPFGIHKVTLLRQGFAGPSRSLSYAKASQGRQGHPSTSLGTGNVTSNIEILYEVVGKGTELLSQRRPGEYLDIIGPLGNGFNYRIPPAPSQVEGYPVSRFSLPAAWELHP